MARKPVKKHFEFYRSFDSSITDTKSDGHHLEPCEPRLQRATTRTLSKVCAEKYGAGNFVALEIGEDVFNSQALAYWIIKIRAGGRYIKKEVFIETEQLRAYRQTRYLIPTEDGEALTLDAGRPYWNDSFPSLLPTDNPFLKSPHCWMRGSEAALVSHELRALPEPTERKKAIAKRNEPETAHNYVRRRRREGARKKIIVSEVTEKYRVNADRAEGIYRNALRTLQQRRVKRREKREAKTGVKQKSVGTRAKR